MAKCRYCERRMIEPLGPGGAQLLFVMAEPSEYDLDDRSPISGPAGQVLDKELIRLSVNPERVTKALIWGHAPTAKKDEKYEDELNFHLGRLVHVASQHSAVLLMGAEASRLVLQEDVMDIAGLKRDSILLPDKLVMATISPLFQTVGEFRTDLTKFIRLAKRYM